MEKKQFQVNGMVVTYVTDVTFEQYDRYASRVDDDLWDFSISDFLTGAIEPLQDIVYCLIGNRLYETAIGEDAEVGDIRAEFNKKEDLNKIYKFSFVRSVEIKAKDLDDAVKRFSEIGVNTDFVEATCVTDDTFVTEQVLKLLEAEK